MNLSSLSHGVDVDSPDLNTTQDPSLGSTAREAEFALRHPRIAADIGTVSRGSSNISTVAARFAGRIGLRENSTHEGSEVNAFRHTLWQATIANKYGQGIAKQAGDAHEVDPNADLKFRIFKGPNAEARADQTADLLNNRIGRQIAADNPHATPQELALLTLDYFRDQGLYTTYRGQGVYRTGDGDEVHVEQTRITWDQHRDAHNRIQGLNNFGRTTQEQRQADDEFRRRQLERNDRR